MKFKKCACSIITLILVLNMTIPYSVSAASTAKYGVLIADVENNYSLYDDLTVVSPKKNIMVKAYSLCKKLGLSYSYNKSTKKLTIKNKDNGKSLEYTRGEKTFTYYSSERAKGSKKTAEYQCYYDKENKCNVIHISTLQYLINYNYHKITKEEVDYYKKGYRGLVVYSKKLEEPLIPTFTNYGEKEFFNLFKAYSIKTSIDKKIKHIYLNDFVFGNGIYLVTFAIVYDYNDEDYYEVICYSKDGSNWKQVLTEKYLSILGYENNKFFVEQSDGEATKFLESSDGINWDEVTLNYEPSLHSSPGYYELFLGPIVYGNKMYLTYTGVHTTFLQYHNDNLIPITPIVYKSLDNINWTDNYKEQYDALVKKEKLLDNKNNVVGYMNYGEKSQFNDMIFHEGLFLGVTGDYFASSKDGLNWSYSDRFKLTNDDYDNYLWSIEKGNGICVIAGGDNIWCSLDGENWMLVYKDKNASFTEVAYGNGVFTVVNNEEKYILISQDGLKWSKIKLPSQYIRLTSIYFCNGRFYLEAVGWDNSGWYISD